MTSSLYVRRPQFCMYLKNDREYIKPHVAVSVKLLQRVSHILHRRVSGTTSDTSPPSSHIYDTAADGRQDQSCLGYSQESDGATHNTRSSDKIAQ